MPDRSNVKIKKRCAKCGTIRRYRERERKCKVQKFGPRSYCCWGHLEPVVVERKPRVTMKDRLAKMAAEGEIDAAQLFESGELFRMAAKKKLHRTSAKIAAMQRQAKQIRRRLILLRRDLVRLARESVMTDAEIAARQFRDARKLFAGRPQ